jgi:hypothetical protein
LNGDRLLFGFPGCPVRADVSASSAYLSASSWVKASALSELQASLALARTELARCKAKGFSRDVGGEHQGSALCQRVPARQEHMTG